jgi:hypothetical protein
MTVGVSVPIVAVGLETESDSCVHYVSHFKISILWPKPPFAMEGRYAQVYFGAEARLIERAVEVQGKVSECTCTAKKLRAFK